MKNKTILTLTIIITAVMLSAIIIMICLAAAGRFSGNHGSSGTEEGERRRDSSWSAPDYVSYKPLTVNEYSRPGDRLEKVNGIVVHYVGNPGTTAEQNRSYFEGLRESGATYASAHFVIGLDGEIIQCIPLSEIAYASNSRNSDTIAIECCHNDETGEFTEATYKALVKLCKELCNQFSLDPMESIIRHYDVTGKLCPLFFVEHPDEWEQLKRDIAGE